MGEIQIVNLEKTVGDRLTTTAAALLVLWFVDRAQQIFAKKVVTLHTFVLMEKLSIHTLVRVKMTNVLTTTGYMRSPNLNQMPCVTPGMVSQSTKTVSILMILANTSSVWTASSA